MSNLKIAHAILKWLTVKTILRFFPALTLFCAALVLWHPALGVTIYALLGFIAIVGTNTKFPATLTQAYALWRNLMTGIKLKPLKFASKSETN